MGLSALTHWSSIPQELRREVPFFMVEEKREQVALANPLPLEAILRKPDGVLWSIGPRRVKIVIKSYPF